MYYINILYKHNPFCPKMSVFVHKIQALQVHTRLAEITLQKHILLFLKSLYRFMTILARKKFFNPPFLEFKHKKQFFL